VEGVDLYGPPERQHHTAPGVGAPQTAPAQGAVRAQLRPKLNPRAGQAVYKLRKARGEPVCGQSKEVRGFRRFSFRGLAQGAAEGTLSCLTHNRLKLLRERTGLRAA